MQSLEHQMLAFARSKPADEAYPYSSNEDCAGCQMLRAYGYPILRMGGNYWRDTAETKHPISERLDKALATAPYTFGALAERLSA